MEHTIDDEWDTFMTQADDTSCESEAILSSHILNETCPKASDIYISTKTNISYLNQEVELMTTFWKLPVIDYATPQTGIVKKQMKFNSVTPNELQEIQNNLKDERCVEENIITNIDNPDGRIKFKDIRKVSVGICKKDVVSYRSKKKSAFYNCFVIILRIKTGGMFKEFHVKVFNTGKMEIPGIQTDETFNVILDMVIELLNPHFEKPLSVLKEKTQTVLINSNFNCGFYINREYLFDILRNKYNLECIYDPCSYPGIQCKFYHDNTIDVQTGIKGTKEIYTDVSFMIFRTGSVLIVGKCSEDVLRCIYRFLKDILMAEFLKIGVQIITDDLVSKSKYKKIRKKVIVIDTN